MKSKKKICPICKKKVWIIVGNDELVRIFDLYSVCTKGAYGYFYNMPSYHRCKGSLK